MEDGFEIVEAVFNPQAIADYYYESGEASKKKGLEDIRMKAKQHLSAVGWYFHYIIKESCGKRELRYCPPNRRKKYASLRMACKDYLDSPEQFRDTTNNIQDPKKDKKRKSSFADYYGERMLLCMKRTEKIVKEDDFDTENKIPEKMIVKEDSQEQCRERINNIIAPEFVRKNVQDPKKDKKRKASFADDERMLMCMKSTEKIVKEDDFETQIVKAKFNPQAIADYYNKSDESGKRKDRRDLMMKAQQHLTAVGWHIYKKSCGGPGGKRELRYCPPNRKKKYASLLIACKDYLDSPEQFMETTNNITAPEFVREPNIQHPKKDKRKASLADICGERMLLCMKGTEKIVKEDDFVVPNYSSMHHSLAESCIGLFRDADGVSMNVVTGLEKTNVNDLFSSRRKGAYKRKIGGRGRSGGQNVLALLIKSKLIVPLSKVYYRNKRDSSVMREGRVTSEGIDCSCCNCVFTLTEFEAHAGSTYNRAAANIFLEDGRSLLQMQEQMRSVNKQVKGVNNGFVSDNAGQKGNDDGCSVCMYGGDIIMCDQCPSSFHAHCLGLSEFPTSEYWYCASCCCRICGQNIPRDDSEMSNKRCDQCEQQYHGKCLGEYSVAELGAKKWFCSEECEDISYGLGRLLGKRIVVGENNLTWTVLKNESHVSDAETNRKLNLALAVMHECFKFVKEPWHGGRDVVEDVIFSRKSESKRLDFRGFYTVILEKDGKVVTVATVRVFGDAVAEVPLVATRFKYRRQGMCKTLMDVLGEKLKALDVKKLVLPAIPSVLDTWTGPSFGFSVMTPYDKSMLMNYTFFDFPDTVTCQKLLVVDSQR